MAMIHRALIAWFLLLVFLIHVGLRLDKRTNWNWFVVLIPAWVYDAFLLIYIALLCAWDLRPTLNASLTLCDKVKIFMYRLYQAVLTLLKTTFLILLCMNLNSRVPVFSWYVVFTPILFLMLCLCFNTFRVLIKPTLVD